MEIMVFFSKTPKKKKLCTQGLSAGYDRRIKLGGQKLNNLPQTATLESPTAGTGMRLSFASVTKLFAANGRRGEAGPFRAP
jgi:hypothetical protein